MLILPPPEPNSSKSGVNYTDSSPLGHECRRLQSHLTEQDKAIVAIFDYIESEAPQDHSIRRTL